MLITEIPHIIQSATSTKMMIIEMQKYQIMCYTQQEFWLYVCV